MNRKIIKAEKLPNGATLVTMQGAVDVPVTKTVVGMRTTKADGTPLKRPVRYNEQVESVERRNGVIVREVRRRKTLRKLGVK